MVDEARIDAIERRLARLERLLRVEEPAPVPAPPAAPMHPPAAPPAMPAREPVRAPAVNLAELFGGRVLAWLGRPAGAPRRGLLPVFAVSPRRRAQASRRLLPVLRASPL